MTFFQQVNGEKQGEFLQKIHHQMGRGEEINVRDAVFSYNKEFPGEGALRLFQDVQKMRFVYSNIVEELKRIDAERFTPPPTPMPPQDTNAAANVSS